jgi:predicted nucleic acid-binding protein
VSNPLFVVNASPLIFLAYVDSLPLLSQLAVEVQMPASVVGEILAGRSVPSALLDLRAAEWLKVVPDPSLPATVAAWDLGKGESSVLALAAVRAGSEAILDDLQARRCARSLGVPMTGTLGVLLRAKRAGLIPAARPLIEELMRRRMFLARNLIELALREVGE